MFSILNTDTAQKARSPWDIESSYKILVSDSTALRLKWSSNTANKFTFMGATITVQSTQVIQTEKTTNAFILRGKLQLK